MALGTTRRVPASRCLGCGALVAADAAFCPSCGTRQYPDQTMPVQTEVGDAARLRRSTDAWLLVGMVALAVVILLVGVAIGGLATCG